MIRTIQSTKELGTLIRTVRKAQGIRQDELAAMVPASHVFIIDVERGKPTAHIGKVLDLLRELGIKITLDTPEAPRQRLKPKSRTSTTRRNG